MLQIIIQGRGGQGAQTAGNLLATAFFAAGRQVQAFSSYGGARRGTPVSSFIRVDDWPIRLRCDIERADAILCFDSTLLDARLLAAASPDTLIVVNSAQSPEPCCRIPTTAWLVLWEVVLGWVSPGLSWVCSAAESTS